MQTGKHPGNLGQIDDWFISYLDFKCLGNIFRAE